MFVIPCDVAEEVLRLGEEIPHMRQLSAEEIPRLLQRIPEQIPHMMQFVAEKVLLHSEVEISHIAAEKILLGEEIPCMQKKIDQGGLRQRRTS